MLKGIIVSIVILGIITTIYLLNLRKRRKYAAYPMPAGTKFILHHYVPFYRDLPQEEQKNFETRVKDFLARTKITGVSGVVVQDMDRIFIAASAVMLLYSFPKTRYFNLDEVLLYPGNFNQHYDTDGPWRNFSGMVGTGVLHRQMILSQAAVRSGFLFPDNAHNTTIHEFAHLIDKADGAIDGIPDYLLNKTTKKQWRAMVPQYIQAIKQGITDINPYGATNQSEFFAVITEYYFKQPEQLRHNYPELYDMLKGMYHPQKAA